MLSVELYVGVGVSERLRLYDILFIIIISSALHKLLNVLFLGTDDIIWALGGKTYVKSRWAKVAKSGEETDDRHTLSFQKEILISTPDFLPIFVM